MHTFAGPSAFKQRCHSSSNEENWQRINKSVASMSVKQRGSRAVKGLQQNHMTLVCRKAASRRINGFYGIPKAAVKLISAATVPHGSCHDPRCFSNAAHFHGCLRSIWYVVNRKQSHATVERGVWVRQVLRIAELEGYSWIGSLCSSVIDESPRRIDALRSSRPG